MFTAGIVIPFYNHERSIVPLVGELRGLGLPCVLVDDGSAAECRPVLQALAQSEAHWLHVVSLPVNQGKGGAVMAGMQHAAAAGWSHVAQIDADGQHRVADLRRLLAMASAAPDAVICGTPVYGDDVPRARLYGRYLTHVWVWINTLSLQIRDAMCGLRIYPTRVTLAAWRDAQRSALGGMGRRMSFDIEILVHLHWRGVRVRHAPVTVNYPADGVSHFRLWRDNLQISGAHARLFLGMLWRAPRLLARHLLRRDAGADAGAAT